MKLSTEEASYGMACHVYLMARLRRALSPLTDITRCGAVLTANSNYVDGDIKVRTNIPGGVNPAADVNEDDAYLFNRISKTSHCDSNCHGSHSGKRFIAQHHSQVGTRKKKKLTHIQLNHPINQTQTVSKHTMDTLNLTQRQHPVSSVVIKGGDSEILVNNFKHYNLCTSVSETTVLPSNTPLLQHNGITINKPIDFYHSYKALLDRIKNISD